jgi:hypothetical protein
MKKFKLKPERSGSKINIIIDVDTDQPLLCPDQQSIVLPGQLQGQLQILRNPCASNCPFFFIKNNSIDLECRTKTILINIEPEPQEEKLKLI